MKYLFADGPLAGKSIDYRVAPSMIKVKAEGSTQVRLEDLTHSDQPFMVPHYGLVTSSTYIEQHGRNYSGVYVFHHPENLYANS